MPTRSMTRKQRRSVHLRKTFLVRLHYVNADMSINYEYYRTLEDARQFCLMWIMACEEAPEHLKQRAEIWQDGKLISSFDEPICFDEAA